MTITIPSHLLFQKVEDQIVSRVVLDLTLYLVGPTLNELDYLIKLYSRVCPADRLNRYTITELEFWPNISNPVLTASGRIASQEGASYPYFEPVRRRIQDGRAFDAQFWDGQEMSEPEGSWNFSCRRLHNRLTGLHAFVRISLPIQSDYEILRSLAIEIVDNIDIYSGHGGISFIYDPWQREVAFDRIYVQAKRYWGVDIEYLNTTLPLMKNAIKGISWITIVGNKFLEDGSKGRIVNSIAQEPCIQLESREKGLIFIIGKQPIIADVRNFHDANLKPYFTLGSILKPLFPTYHPDFPGKLFYETGNTDGWIRRFIDPKGWGGRG